MKRFFSKENRRYLVPTALLLLLWPWLIRGFFLNLEEDTGFGVVVNATFNMVTAFWIVKNMASMLGYSVRFWQVIKRRTAGNRFCRWLAKLNRPDTVLVICGPLMLLSMVIEYAVLGELEGYVIPVTVMVALVVDSEKGAALEAAKSRHRRRPAQSSAQQKKAHQLSLWGASIFVVGVTLYGFGLLLPPLFGVGGIMNIVGIVLLCKGYGLSSKAEDAAQPQASADARQAPGKQTTALPDKTVVRPAGELKRVKIAIWRMKQQSPVAERVAEATKALGALVLQQSPVYCLYDEDCHGLPYVDALGHVEIYSDYTYACEAVAHYAQENEAHVAVSPVIEDVKAFIQRMAFDGVTKLRLDNGHYPVELDFADVLESIRFSVAHMAEVLHCDTRGCLMRLKQLEARKAHGRNGLDTVYPLIAPSIKQTALERLKTTPLFVLAPGTNISGATMCTETALAQLAASQRPDLPVVLPGTANCVTVGGDVPVKRVTGPGADGSVAQSHVCVFTTFAAAREAHRAFGLRKKDGILLMSFREIAHKALEGKGIVVDCTAYGYELLREDLLSMQNEEEPSCTAL